VFDVNCCHVAIMKVQMVGDHPNLLGFVRFGCDRAGGTTVP
jgi:hypothetical protein